uniref:PFU domain-containing protein n=1 Tax=Parascaris univalens TaxID=6257 RepID=A0A914ZZ52_PARUN
MSGGCVAPFTFSRVIPAHSSDVKGVSATSTGLLLSGSRDGTAKIFSERADEYSEMLCMKQAAEVAVNAVAFHQLPTGWLVFLGRMDGSIAVFSSECVEPIRFLRQHTNNVCALHVDSVNDKLVSGSWDNNAIVWSISDSAHFMVLIGHKMTVWAIASIVGRPNYYLTGSADMTIKLWNGNTLVNTYTGHEDVVRCIVILSSNIFASASNDCSIRVWDLDATACLRKYTSFACEYIYGMTVVGSGRERMLANCGESGFVELWAVDSEYQLFHSQFLRTPAQSVWSIVALSNGDIAAGGNDGNIYIFTTNEKRRATRNELQVFDTNVAKRVAEAEALLAAQQQEVVKIKVALGEGEPDMELRYRKGADPAEAAETFIKENNMPAAFIGEITEYIKANIPEARRAAAKQAARMQAAQHIIVDGQKWDYLFDVTTEDGRLLKLPYNVGEDPDWAARRFVERNNLPVQFVHKVSAVLRMQLPQASVTPNNSVAFVDPYTGAGRYIPSTISATQDALAVGLLTDKKRPRGEFVPLHEFFRFGFEKVSSKAVAKLKEMNELQVDHRLTNEQLVAMEDILTNSTYKVTDVHISAISTGLLWTHRELFVTSLSFR